MQQSRRRLLATAGGLLAGGLAGCIGDEDPNAAAGGENGSDPAASVEGDPVGSYTVEMAPVGEVEFDAVPERWSTYFPGYAEMGIALGHGDGLSAIGNAGRFHTDHLAELGLGVDREDLVELNSRSGIDVELYYEVDADVHLTDPQWLVNNGHFGLEEDDVADVEERVGPFVGNTIFRRTDEWHDYRYYTLYEAFEVVADVFRERDRFEAFRSLHDEVVAGVQAELPPADERPSALLCWAGADEPEEFSPYRLTDRGTNKKQWRDLGVEDALAGTGISGLSTTDRGTIDYETIADVDPDVLLVRGHEDKSDEAFRDTVLGYMEDHPVASGLTAVENGDVYRGGPIYLGPIHHLFELERAATQLYPAVFEGDLFGRDDVADLVTDGA